MLNIASVHEIVDRALAEDAPWGDITTRAIVPIDTQIEAKMVAREPGIMAASQVIISAFRDLETNVCVKDGTRFKAGQTLATISGGAHKVLLSERVGLNLTQRLCGIATLTDAYVSAVADYEVCIVDTRKTTPGLRLLEKYAVTCGGGQNHRYSLSDAVLVKDNHLAAVTNSGIDVTNALRIVKVNVPHTTHIEVEVDRLDQIEPVLASGVVNTIMLDNFSIKDLIEGVSIVNGRADIEASGGVNLDTVAAIASTGVDVISVGALTQNPRTLDIGLDIDLL